MGTDASTPDLSPGERRKRSVHNLLETKRQLYILRGRRALLLTLLDCGLGVMDDVRRAVELPPDLNPKLFGAVPGHLVRACIIRAAGYATSTRPEAHARPIQVWQLADADAARAWLADHPDSPEPAGEPAPGGDDTGWLFPAAAAEGVAHA